MNMTRKAFIASAAAATVVPNVGMAFADHPVLSGVPHGSSVDGLFFRILG